MAHIRGEAHEGARLGGHLLTLAGDRDFPSMFDEVASLVLPEGSHNGRYGSVVDWVVTTLAGVIVEKMDPVAGGTCDLAVVIEGPDGRMVPVDRLPAPDRHVWTAVVDVLTGHPDRVPAHLAPLLRATGEAGQAQALIDAVAWIDRLLDMPLSEEPDA